MIQLTIDPEFQALIPPLRKEELEALHRSLELEGCRDALVVWAGDGAIADAPPILLDGHNRYLYCIFKKVPFRTVERSFLNRDAAKLWVLENQLGRRNLCDLDRIALAAKHEDIIKAKAKAKQREAGGDQKSAKRKTAPKVQGTTPKVEETVPPKSAEPIEARSEAAKLARVGKDTYTKGKTVLEKGSPALVAAVKEEKASIHAAAAVAELPKQEQEDIVAKGAAEIKAAAKKIREEELERKKQEREAKRLAELEARAKIAEKNKLALMPQTWEVIQGDCIELLHARRKDNKEKARLIFADPPYNIGIEYGDHYDDARNADDFQRWCHSWMVEVYENLTDDGSFWLLVNYEWAWVLCAEAVETIGFKLHQWLTWYEAFGVNTTRKFNRTSRPLLWFTKEVAIDSHGSRDPNAYVFNEDAVEIRRPSDRQIKYNDKRADPDGKLWDDVWGINPAIPRVTGTSAERIPSFPTQLPMALLRPIIACATKPNDLVIDPFNGSGTTGAVATELGRRYVGFELSDQFADLSRKRLLALSSEVA